MSETTRWSIIRGKLDVLDVPPGLDYETWSATMDRCARQIDDALAPAAESQVDAIACCISEMRARDESLAARASAQLAALVTMEPEALPFPEYGAVTLCMLEDGDVAIYQADTIAPKAKLLARGESVEDAWERMFTTPPGERP